MNSKKLTYRENSQRKFQLFVILHYYFFAKVLAKFSAKFLAKFWLVGLLKNWPIWPTGQVGRLTTWLWMHKVSFILVENYHFLMCFLKILESSSKWSVPVTKMAKKKFIVLCCEQSKEYCSPATNKTFKTAPRTHILLYNVPTVQEVISKWALTPECHLTTPALRWIVKMHLSFKNMKRTLSRETRNNRTCNLTRCCFVLFSFDVHRTFCSAFSSPTFWRQRNHFATIAALWKWKNALKFCFSKEKCSKCQKASRKNDRATQIFVTNLILIENGKPGSKFPNTESLYQISASWRDDKNYADKFD